MNKADDNKNNDNDETVHVPRSVLVINATLSVVVFAVLSLLYYETDFSPFLMWFIAVLAGGILLLNATLRRERRSDLNRILLPWFVLGIIFLIYDMQVQRLKEDLTNAKIAAAGYRDAAERKEFDRLWNSAESFALVDLERLLVSIDPTQTLYSRALLYHEQRRLDEASYLYREVLERRKPKRPKQEQKQLAERFLPRLYTTEKEPFKLEDLVVVIHPSKPLIGYHLVWEDDIDFLIDNDPGDHEIVWIQYDEAQEQVEQVWAYWHGNIFQTEEAVEDANSHDSRVAIYVQWGKHGSLLKGWGEIIAVDSDKKERYEPLQYSRLSSDDGTRLARGNERAIGFHAEQFPELFDGTEEEFKTFPKEVDLQERLRMKEMIVVSKYANAVIDQWFLPYNIYPKPDWPTD